MDKEQARLLYFRVKSGRPSLYDEEFHCIKLLEVMSDYKKSTQSAFCAECEISEKTFQNWVKTHEIFMECYGLGRMIARENWEAEGQIIQHETCMPGTSNHRFEYWRHIGWSRFGIGKNSRIRLDLDPNSSPNQHYNQLIKQASQGDFTAGEIKQLMEAINVGLNAHQVFKLQTELDELKADLVTMTENANGHNQFADKRTT